LVNVSELKIPKKEKLVLSRYTKDHKNLDYVITQILRLSELKFNLYKVNQDGSINKVDSASQPIFKQIHGEQTND
jgi:hypothetical protein